MSVDCDSFGLSEVSPAGSELFQRLATELGSDGLGAGVGVVLKVDVGLGSDQLVAELLDLEVDVFAGAEEGTLRGFDSLVVLFSDERLKGDGWARRECRHLGGYPGRNPRACHAERQVSVNPHVLDPGESHGIVIDGALGARVGRLGRSSRERRVGGARAEVDLSEGGQLGVGAFH